MFGRHLLHSKHLNHADVVVFKFGHHPGLSRQCNSYRNLFAVDPLARCSVVDVADRFGVDAQQWQLICRLKDGKANLKACCWGSEAQKNGQSIQ